MLAMVVFLNNNRIARQVCNTKNHPPKGADHDHPPIDPYKRFRFTARGNLPDLHAAILPRHGAVLDCDSCSIFVRRVRNVFCNRGHNTEHIVGDAYLRACSALSIESEGTRASRLW